MCIGDLKVRSQFFGGRLRIQPKQLRCKINHISIGTAAEAMEPLVHLHAGCPIIVKGTVGFSCPVDMNAVALCRLSGCDGLFDRFKYIHCVLLSGNNKDTRHFRRENGKCLLEFHILFFVLRRFLLLFLFFLFLIELDLFGRRVLRFRLLLGFRLFRHKDFANPIANIFHWL